MKRPESKLKDKAWEEYVTHLENDIKRLKTSPHYKSYITIYDQIDDWNDQLTISQEKITIPIGPDEKGDMQYEVRQQGKIDLFADKDTKDFERAVKYFTELQGLLKTLDEIRNKMDPEDKEALEKREALSKAGMTERILTKLNEESK